MPAELIINRKNENNNDKVDLFLDDINGAIRKLDKNYVNKQFELSYKKWIQKNNQIRYKIVKILNKKHTQKGMLHDRYTFHLHTALRLLFISTY